MLNVCLTRFRFFRSQNDAQQLAAGPLRNHEILVLGRGTNRATARWILDGNRILYLLLFFFPLFRANAAPVIVNNIEYGRGTGITRGAAADRAAEQVLIALRGY